MQIGALKRQEAFKEFGLHIQEVETAKSEEKERRKSALHRYAEKMVTVYPDTAPVVYGVIRARGV